MENRWLDKVRVSFNWRLTVIFAILTFLFFLPFFWGSQETYHLGGDDSRLYLYSPEGWLKNIALWSWPPLSGVALYGPQHAYLPFNLLGSSIKFLLPFLNLPGVCR